MNRRRMTMAMALGGAALALGQRDTRQSSVLAGGWASLELINPLQVAVVGIPAHLQAQVLQHGVHPNAAMPAAIGFVHEASGEELVSRLEVVSQDMAIVRGECTFSEPGRWRMRTVDMGPEIDIGQVEVVNPEPGDIVTRSVGMNTGLACAQDDIAGGITTEILDMAFADPLLEVRAGTTVTWVNTSAIPHQVVFKEAAFDSSMLLREGDRFSVTFAEPGSFSYFCGPHPSMAGMVEVSA